MQLPKALLLIVAVLLQSTAIAGPPVAFDFLIAQSGAVSLENPDITSIQFTSSFPVATGLPVAVDWSWTPDTGATMLVFDPKTDMPVAFATQQRAMIYDCVAQSLLVIEDAYPSLELRPSAGSLAISYGLRESTAALEFDPASFLDSTRQVALKPKSDTTWVATQISRSGRSEIVGRFDVTRKWPLQQVELRPVGSDRSLFSVKQISVNHPTNEAQYVFPDLTRLPTGLSVKPLAWDQFGERSKFAVTQAVLSRFALSSPAYRMKLAESISGSAIRDVNWDETKRRDRVVGPSLRRLVHAARWRPTK